jgi:methyltransferase family protein
MDKAESRMTSKLYRLAFHLPWHFAITRQVLGRRGEISLLEARFLGTLVRRSPPARPIIEIGTLFGGSTRIIALFKAPETTLITVDSFRWNPFGLTRSQHLEITRKALAEVVGNDNVELCEVDKDAFYSTYDGASPGLVFLDANHSYESTKRDIQWAQSVKAGVICGHDYSPQFPGVMKAVSESGGASRVVGTLFELNPTT